MQMYFKNLIPVSCILLMFASCKEEASVAMQELDLLEHGMPIIIRAPENPEIRKMDLIMSKDISVVKGDDYNVQIFESDADTRDVTVIKNRLLKEVKRNPYFSTIVKDEPAGFIYETRVDSNYINYGFRHIRIQGDKEYIFQQGLRGKFSQEAVETMYKAVQ